MSVPSPSRQRICTAALVVITAFSLQAAPKPAVHSKPQLQPIAAMAQARAAHQATLLPSGDVLISGGCSNRCNKAATMAELYLHTTERFLSLSATPLPRDSHIAQLLPDGRVLLAGGWRNGQITAQAELYQSGQGFRTIASMHQGRGASAAATLQDGRILISGGQAANFQPLATAEWYDPAMARFVVASSMHSPRVGHTATTLQDGRVLITGGRPGRRDKALNTAEIFDPQTNSFSPTGHMINARQKHAAVLLPDGKVLLLGGSDGNDTNKLSSTEWFNPATGEFSTGPSMHYPRFKIPDAVVAMPDGGLLVAGGAEQPEYLNPQTGQFERLPQPLGLAPEFATATLLTNGKVLLLGGYDAQINTSAQAWLITLP